VSRRKARFGLERGLCAICGKNVAVRVPHGGDGAATYPYRHTRGGTAEAVWVWCDGPMYESVAVSEEAGR
jgi:hypothetical protein